MPVEYDYDANTNIIHAYPYAELSITEIQGFFNDLIRDDAIADQSIEVVHFDRVDNFLFSYDKADGIISLLTHLRNEKGLQATVFVCKNDLQYGVARMLQTLYTIHDSKYMTFVLRNDKELPRILHSIGANNCIKPTL